MNSPQATKAPFSGQTTVVVLLLLLLIIVSLATSVFADETVFTERIGINDSATVLVSTEEYDVFSSPDGKFVAVTYQPNMETVLTYITDTNGRRITKERIGSFVSWAPDSSKVLVYVSGYSGEESRKIYSIDLKDNYSDFGLPAGTVSADVSISGNIVHSVAAPGTDRTDLYIRYPDGEDELIRKGEGVMFAWVRWSPDGKKIAFMQSDLFGSSGMQSTWIMDTATQKLERVSEIEWNYPQIWSPDGTSIVFANNGDIWSFDVASSSLKQVSNFKDSSANRPTYSSDGRILAFTEHNSLINNIWTLQDGELVEVLKATPSSNAVILKP